MMMDVRDKMSAHPSSLSLKTEIIFGNLGQGSRKKKFVFYYSTIKALTTHPFELNGTAIKEK